MVYAHYLSPSTKEGEGGTTVNASQVSRPESIQQPLTWKEVANKAVGVDDRVYRNYRDGKIEKGRDGIRDFDRAVGSFLKEGVINIEDGRIMTFNPSNLLSEMFYALKDEIARDSWPKPSPSEGMNKDDWLLKCVYEEMLGSVERYYMDRAWREHGDKSNYGNYFANPAALEKNIGVEMGFGLVLTTGTRDSLKVKARKKLTELAAKGHSDVTGGPSREELKKYTGLYSMFTKGDYFNS